MGLLVAFLAIPLIEIALFIQIGDWIGLGWTLVIVVLTALAGTFLVRSQGAIALGELRNSMNELRDPTEPLAHGAMILFSGALLLTPGFFTDAVGFALLMPPVRRWAIAEGRKRIKVRNLQYGTASPRPRSREHPDVIDAEYEEVPPSKRNGPSGWTRH